MFQFPLPHSRGSSHGQSRGIRRAYPDPFFTRLMEEAYREWGVIERAQRVQLIRCGGAVVTTVTGMLLQKDRSAVFLRGAW